MTFYKGVKKVLIFLIVYFTIYSIAVVPFTLSIILAAYSWWYGSNIFDKIKRPLPPKCLQSDIYGQHSYLQIKNVKLHYVEKGDKSKPLILFLHGFPDFWFSWRNQLTHFSENYWTVAVDLRGFGDSEKPSGVSYYKMKYLVEDIKNLITALGREKCIIVAHDWGAVISWKFLSSYPDMVEKYCLINMYHPQFITARTWKQIFRSWYLLFFQIPILPEIYLKLKDLEIFQKLFNSKDEDVVESYKFTFGKPGSLTHALNHYRANIFLGKRKGNKLENLPQGLVVYAKNNKLIDMTNYNCTKNNSNNLKSILIENGGHFVHQKNAEQVNKIIDDFLKGQATTSSSSKEESMHSSDNAL